MITMMEKEVYQKYKRFTVYNFYKVLVDPEGNKTKKFLYRSTYDLTKA